MKKTRKVLSLVLALVLAFSSMPVVYINTAAADAVALAETGTPENPTRAVEATGSFAYKDLVKITIEVFNTDYTFYQTKDDECFTLTQSYYFQKINADDINVTFEHVGLWDKKTSDMSNPNSSSLEWRGNEDDGLWEIPGIKDNRTDLFLANHLVSEAWVPTTPAAEAITSVPFLFSESSRYAWNYNIVLKGNSANETGEHNTNFYQQLKWSWVAKDNSDFAKVDIRLQTRVRMLDAREFAKELARLEAIVANPDEYTKAYVSSAQAILNEIPEDLKNFSVVYDQSVIDKHTQNMKNLSLNSADYTEYNQIYTELSKITNEKGAYTEKSFATFQNEIARINANLNKSLDKTQQGTVDAAVAALKAAYNSLVATDLSDSNSGWSSRDKGYGNIQAELNQTAYKFMQTRDYQKFQFDQRFYIRRYGGNNSSRFYGLYFEENYPTCGSTCAGDTSLTNGTTAFLNLMDQGMLSTITANNEDEKSITAKEFNQWVWDGSVTNAGDSIVSNGLLTHDFKLAKGGTLGMGEYLAYAANSSPVFYGRTAGDYGEIDLTYIYRLGYMYDSSGTAIPNKKYYHWHIPTTIEVTDVRQLISSVDNAEDVIANPSEYEEKYVYALQAAAGAVPMEMLKGVEYYTQEEVDAFYNQLNNLLVAGDENADQLADYSEFAELFERLTALENASRYTEDSYAVFVEEIYEINKNLDKNLTADQQATVDKAVQDLYASYAKLEFYEVGDKENVFTNDDVPDYMGNSNLDFAVSNTEYTFIQTYDNQTFAIDTELYLESTNDNYDTYIYGLEYSMVKAGDTTCANRETPDAGCHNLQNVIVPDGVAFTDGFLDVVSEGVEKAAKDGNGNYILASDGTGSIGKNTTWVFDSKRSIGSSFVNNGLISYGAQIGTAPHYATSTIVCNGFAGETTGEEKGFEAVYSWRLGWGYKEKHILDNLVNFSSTTYRHVHIPVRVKLTDARAFASLYFEVENILKGKTDVKYTLESLVNLYEAFNNAEHDMATGSVYYTQEEANIEYAKLKAAFDALESGADYSEYFNAYVDAQEIINSNNEDSRGNTLYDEAAYEEFVKIVESTHNGLDKELENTDANQAIIDKATQDIKDAIATLETTKRADYSDLNDAMTEAEKILNAPEGTYTDKTLEKVQEAYDNAVDLDKNLPADKQYQVDFTTDALENAIAGKEYKADYSEYDQAYDIVKDIIDNPDKYTDETVKAAQDAMNSAGGINKDLADTAANRQTIKDATDVLNNVVVNAVKRADYSAFDEAYKTVEEIANDTTGKYTDATIQSAKDALVEADKLDKNLPLSDANQATVNAAKDALQAVIDNAQLKADYTDYNDAKSAADKIIESGNLDANGNPIYNQEAFDAYKEAVENIDKTLGKDLPASEQSKVDEAAKNLEDLKAELEKTTGYDTVILDPETTVDEVLKDFDYNTDEVIIEIKDYTGKELTSLDFVGTGSTLKITLKSTGEILEYKLFIVMGDVDGDSDVDADDYQKSMNVGLKKESYLQEHSYFFTANDMNADSYIDVLDCALIRRMY